MISLVRRQERNAAFSVTSKAWKNHPSQAGLSVLNKRRLAMTVTGTGGKFSSKLKRAKVDDFWVY